MNYFNELLESYNKLKKRELTVKIDESKFRGTYLALPPDLKKQVDAKLAQEFGPSLNSPSKSLPLSNKEKKFFSRAQAYIYGDPKKSFKVKFNHLDSGKELTLVHSDGQLDWERFRQYRNQLAAEIMKRNPTAAKNAQVNAGEQEVEPEEDPNTVVTGQAPEDLLGGGLEGQEGGQENNMLDSFFNSEGELNSPEHHLSEVLANLVYLAKQKSFFIMDHPIIAKGDDDSYPGIKNFILMEFGFKLQTAFGLQLDPLNKTLNPQPLGQKDITHIIKLLEWTIARCLKFHEGTFLEEDAIWIHNHMFTDEFGTWVKDPLLLNFSMFVDPKGSIFSLLAESFNFAYQEWANQKKITASYKIVDHSFHGTKRVSRFYNDPYSLDIILPSVGTNIANLFRERLAGMNNDNNLAHFVLAFNNNLQVAKSYVNQFLTGQIITSNQVLDFEQLLATKIPEFSKVVNLISPLLKSTGNLKNTQNRFYIYTQPRAIKIGEKAFEDLTPVMPELESIDKAFQKIKLQRVQDTELRREAINTFKSYLKRSTIYQNLMFIHDFDKVDLEDDYFISYIRECLKAEYLINRLNNCSKEGKVTVLNNLLEFILNDVTYCYIINSMQLIQANKSSLKFNTSIVNPLSNSRLYIHPGLYLVVTKYVDQGLVNSKLSIYIDYNSKDRVIDASLKEHIVR